MLHRLPGSTSQLESSFAPGDIITEFVVAARPWTRRSLYLKVRDRQSYEFVVASAAVAPDLDRWVCATPAPRWAAFASQQPQLHNAIRIALGEATLVRALRGRHHGA